MHAWPMRAPMSRRSLPSQSHSDLEHNECRTITTQWKLLGSRSRSILCWQEDISFATALSQLLLPWNCAGALAIPSRLNRFLVALQTHGGQDVFRLCRAHPRSYWMLRTTLLAHGRCAPLSRHATMGSLSPLFSELCAIRRSAKLQKFCFRLPIK